MTVPKLEEREMAFFQQKAERFPRIGEVWPARGIDCCDFDIGFQVQNRPILQIWDHFHSNETQYIPFRLWARFLDARLMLHYKRSTAFLCWDGISSELSRMPNYSGWRAWAATRPTTLPRESDPAGNRFSSIDRSQPDNVKILNLKTR